MSSSVFRRPWFVVGALASVALVPVALALGACDPDPVAGGPSADSGADASLADAAPNEASTADAGDAGRGELVHVAGGLGAAGHLDGVGGDARVSVVALAGDEASRSLWLLSGEVIRQLDTTTGAVRTVAGVDDDPRIVDGPAPNARIRSVESAAYDPASKALYFGDSDRVRRLDTVTGAIETVLVPTDGPDAGPPDSGFRIRPTRLVLDPDRHRLYVAGIDCELWTIDTTTRQTVSIWGSRTSCTAVDGPLAAASFSFRSEPPMTIDRTTGRIFLVDGDQIRVVDPVAGTVSSKTFANVGLRSGIAYDPTAEEVLVPGINELYAVDVRPPFGGTVVPRLVAGALREEGTVDGPALTARFAGPYGVIHFAGTGETFLADVATVRKLAQGTVSTLVGRPAEYGATDGVGRAARFRSATSVAYDPAANIAYVTDTASYTLRSVDLATGEVKTVAGYPEARGGNDGPYMTSQFQDPKAVAFDTTTKIAYVADRGNSAIRAYDTTTKLLSTFVGGAAAAGFVDGPKVLAKLAEPSSVTCDSAGHTLYFVDGVTIRSVDTQSIVVRTIAGSQAAPEMVDDVGTAARFAGPTGLAYDPAKKILYVADTLQNMPQAVIRAVDVMTGRVTTLTGKRDVRAFIDGPKADAALRAPSGLLLDPSGQTLLVTDGSTLRAISTASGAITTRIGGPGRRGVRLGPLAGASLHGVLDPGFLAQGLAWAGTDLLIVETAEGALLRASGLGL